MKKLIISILVGMMLVGCAPCNKRVAFMYPPRISSYQAAKILNTKGVCSSTVIVPGPGWDSIPATECNYITEVKK